MTITTRPATPEYHDGWERTFGAPPVMAVGQKILLTGQGDEVDGVYTVGEVYSSKETGERYVAAKREVEALPCP
jgi:hypothetical protein